MRDNNKTKKLTKVLFIIYLIVLFWIIVFKFNLQLPPLRSINIIALTGTILMILILFLLKTNRLWIFRMGSQVRIEK